MFHSSYIENKSLSGKPKQKRVEAWQFDYDLIEDSECLPVSYDEFKLFARIDATGSDQKDKENEITGEALITSAVNLFESQTGQTLINKTFTAWLDGYPCSGQLRLSKGRIQEVISIKSWDEEGTSETFNSSAYIVDGRNAKISLNGTEIWPTPTRPYQSFSVEYVAGMGEDNADIPEEIKLAIKQIAYHWFENRQSVVDMTLNNVPVSAFAIIEQYKNKANLI